jgi:hypothetical protein
VEPIPSLDSFLGESASSPIVHARGSIPVRVDGKIETVSCSMTVHSGDGPWGGMFISFLPANIDALSSLRKDPKNLEAYLMFRYGSGAVKLVDHPYAGITFRFEPSFVRRAFLDPLDADPS